MSNRSNRGFTLIELLIVVVIIGILAAIAIPKFAASREKAYRSTMKGDLHNLVISQEIYHNENFAYGTDVSAVGARESEGVTITITESSNTGWAATAVHDGLGGEQCGVFHGTASAANGSPATQAGVIGCTN